MLSRAFLVVWFAMFVGTAGIGMVSPLLPVFARELGAEGIWLGLAFSGFALTQGSITPWVGTISDRIGRKPFIFAGLFIYALAALGYLLATTYWQVILIRVFSGAGTAFIFPVSMAYIGEMAPPGKEGSYMGTFNMAQTIGFGSGPLLGGVLRDALGIDSVFYAMGIATFVAAALVMFLLPTVPRHLRKAQDQPSAPFRALIRHHVVAAVLVFQGIWAVWNGAALAFVAILMDEKLQASGTAIGLVLSGRTLVNGWLQPITGRMADRYNRAALVTIGMTCAAVSTLAIPFAGDTFQLLAIFMLLGLFESIAFPSAVAMIVDVGRDLGMGSAMGLLQMSLSAGIFGGSTIGGAIDSSFGVDAVFRFAGTIGFIGAGSFLFLITRRPAPAPVSDIPVAPSEPD